MLPYYPTRQDDPAHNATEPPPAFPTLREGFGESSHLKCRETGESHRGASESKGPSLLAYPTPCPLPHGPSHNHPCLPRMLTPSTLSCLSSHYHDTTTPTPTPTHHTIHPPYVCTSNRRAVLTACTMRPLRMTHQFSPSHSLCSTAAVAPAERDSPIRIRIRIRIPLRVLCIGEKCSAYPLGGLYCPWARSTVLGLLGLNRRRLCGSGKSHEATRRGRPIRWFQTGRPSSRAHLYV